MNNGYKEVTAVGHPLASKNGMVYEHRLVAEKKLGRPLNDEEIVHHVDENRANNNPDNLWVFRSNADHARYHQNKIAIFHEDGTVSSPIVNRKTCQVCGKKSYGNRCQDHRIRRTKISWPDNDELITMIYRTSVSETARNLGVSCGSIKHRLQRRGLWRPLR